MSIKDYADVLKFAMKMQIEYLKEDMGKPWTDESYLAGVMAGLNIAMEKIDARMFLAENK